jgi:hypothetical protein
MSPTPDQTPEHGSHLTERIQNARGQLTVLTEGIPACDDIASGVITALEGDIGGILSDRALKRDITPISWTR